MVLSGVWRFFTPMALPGHLKYLAFHKPLSSGTTEMTFEAEIGEMRANVRKWRHFTQLSHISSHFPPFRLEIGLLGPRRAGPTIFTVKPMVSGGVFPGAQPGK